MSVNVLHDHDRVVDQDADRENQGEQRHPVDREAPGPGREQRGRQRDDDGGADDDGLAPPERIPDEQITETVANASFWISFDALSSAV